MCYYTPQCSNMYYFVCGKCLRKFDFEIHFKIVFLIQKYDTKLSNKILLNKI